jgi:hypothetical protein
VIRWLFANPNYLTQAIWNHPVNSRFLLSAGITTLIFDFPTVPQEGVGPHDISINDQTLGINYNSLGVSTYSYGHHISNQSNQKFDVSYLSDKLPGLPGSHHLKVGVFTMEGKRDQDNTVNTVTLDGIDYPVTYRFANKVPNRITEVIPYRSVERMKIDLGIYGSDAWTFKRLTVNAALRFDHLDNFVPALTQEANVYIGERSLPKVECLPCWSDWSPRLGAAYDLTGDGRTALKGSVGRYVTAQSPNALAHTFAPVVTSVLTTNRVWNDQRFGPDDPRSGNFLPDCDLKNNQDNGECGTVDNLNFGQGIVSSATADPAILTSNRGANWQASIQLQRQLTRGLSVNFGYYRTWQSIGSFTVTDNTKVTPADYSPYAVTAPTNAALPDGGAYTVGGLYDLNPDKQGQSQQNTVFLNSMNLKPCPQGTGSSGQGKLFTEPCGDPRNQVYDGFDVTLSAHVKNAFISGGTSTGRTNTNTCQVIDSPGVLRNCDLGNPFLTQIKLSGSYPLPWDFQLSGTFQNLPGNPYSANVTYGNADVFPTLGRNLTGTTTVSVNVLNPNQQYEKRLNQLDLRVSKRFRVGSGTFEAIVDAYNVFNSDTILSETSTYTGANGGNWRLPSEILAARFVKFGFQVSY